MFPFLIGKVLTMKDLLGAIKNVRRWEFPFLIGKVLTYS